MHPKSSLLASRICRLAAALLLTTLPTTLPAQTETITVDAGNVIRDVPIGLSGVCMASDFWNNLSPNYRDDLVKARVGLVRIVGYPADSPTSVGTVQALDNKVAQLINAGSSPLFIQCIEAESNATFKNALLRLDGTLYPAGDPTPINQRVATNITYLVNRYRSAPFNLTTQYWEIGNEPDITVNYRVASSQEYINFFSLAHTQLQASGVRNNVVLAGPVVSWDYGFNANNGFTDVIMNDFLSACRNQVDVVTRHTYALIYPWEAPVTDTKYNLLNASIETAHFNSAQSGSRGEGSLLTQMLNRGVPATVGTGVTEMNLFHSVSGQNGHRFTITQGLWFLLSDHYSLYNPRSRLTNGFQFDKYSDGTGGGFLGFYDGAKNPSYAYWATYIHGVLTGKQVLAQTSSNPHLVVTATKDDNYIYLRVMNRHDVTSFTANVTLNNSGGVTAPTVFNLSATTNPLTGTGTSLGTSFSRTFAPSSAQIFRFPRNSAPPTVTPVPPPATTHFATSFDSAPTGMQAFADLFTPVVSGGRLQLTSTVSNMKAAVVFNGQPLPAARNRAQIRFGFHVTHPYAEGFIFGAYSASPGVVGNAGQALGYDGQPNRLWGIKIDNNPDQISVISSTTNATADGWATKALPPYAGMDMFVVIDYEGASGKVRARLYQGTNDSGVLWADLTNSLGNPTTLPAGAVFGFTGATGSFSQTTYIDNLTVLADNGVASDFIAAEDSHVRDGTYAGTNQAGATSVVVDVKQDSPPYGRQGYFKFDFGAYSGPVTSATITLTPLIVGKVGIHNQVALVSDNTWTETGITWNNKPAYSTILGTYTITAGTPISIPVTSQVQSAMSTGKKLSIVVFGNDANNGQNNVSYAASESTNSTQRPVLHIQ